mgnify:CR=1 FL=1|jgi:copper chaperone CopZ
MIQNIKISGMTCQGCVSSVSKKLTALEEVQNINIDLATGNVSLEVLNLLRLKKLNEILLPKYIPSLELKTINNNTIKKTPSKLKQLFPLFLIFTYIIAGTLLLQKNNFHITGFMFDFMGLFFMVFSFFKFLDYRNFPKAFAQYDPLAKRSSFYSKIYPFMETLLGIMLLLRLELIFALVATIIILSITTIGVVYSLFYKSKINCACLGTALKLPMTEATLIENMIMLVMTVAMLYHQLR